MREAKPREAIAAFWQVLERYPSHSAAAVNLAYCHVDLKAYAKALAFFSQVFERDPRNYDALYGLAMSYQGLGDHDRAIDSWRRYVREAPESPWKERAREALRLAGVSP